MNPWRLYSASGRKRGTADSSVVDLCRVAFGSFNPIRQTHRVVCVYIEVFWREQRENRVGHKRAACKNNEGLCRFLMGRILSRPRAGRGPLEVERGASLRASHPVPVRGNPGAPRLRGHQLPQPHAHRFPPRDVRDVSAGESPWARWNRWQPSRDGDRPARGLPVPDVLRKQGEPQLGLRVGG